MPKKKTGPPGRITTEFGTIIIEETTARGEPVRLYRHNGAFSSGTFLSDEKKYDILFDYPKRYETAFEFMDIRSALMIGGAAYQYPKYYISHHEGSMDVVEIDPAAEEIARKWFFLDDLYKDYDLNNTHRLNCITRRRQGTVLCLTAQVFFFSCAPGRLRAAGSGITVNPFQFSEKHTAPRFLRAAGMDNDLYASQGGMPRHGRERKELIIIRLYATI